MPRFDKLLVLDLDETLIFSTYGPRDQEPDFKVAPYVTYRRPLSDQFLNSCLDWFEVGIWSSATKVYVDPVLENLIQDMARFSFVWTRERCTLRRTAADPLGYYVEDLKKLRKKGYDLRGVIVVDDDRRAFERNYGNAIRVSEYRGSPNDDELPMLLKYLEKIGSAPDIRTIEKRFWRDEV